MGRTKANVLVTGTAHLGHHGTVKVLRWSAPQDPNQPRPTRHQAEQRAFDDLFPPEPLMRACSAHFRGQGGVEQQHPLASPILEVGGAVDGQATVGGPLFEHVSKRGRPRQQRVLHAERQPVRLPHPVVRVLAQQDHVHLVGRGAFKRTPNRRQRRAQLPCRLQFLDAPTQLLRRSTHSFAAPRRQQFSPVMWRKRPRLRGTEHA